MIGCKISQGPPPSYFVKEKIIGTLDYSYYFIRHISSFVPLSDFRQFLSPLFFARFGNRDLYTPTHMEKWCDVTNGGFSVFSSLDEDHKDHITK